MAEVKSYDFKQVSVIFGGRIITGFAEGDAITVAHDEDDFTLKVGADGEATRSKSNNRAATITLRLMQTSDSNDVLSGMRSADQLTGNGKGPLLIKDNSGRSLHAADSAWVQKAPDAGYGAEAGEREWVLRTGEMISNYGGNS